VKTAPETLTIYSVRVITDDAVDYRRRVAGRDNVIALVARQIETRRNRHNAKVCQVVADAEQHLHRWHGKKDLLIDLFVDGVGCEIRITFETARAGADDA